MLGRPFDEDNIAAIYADIDNLTARYTVLEELPAANLMRLAKAYERYKEDNDLLDYDDLLVMAYTFLAGSRQQVAGEINSQMLPATGYQLPAKYKWIEIDEVQDLNALQFAIVDLLAAEDATIVYLGDEQQAIFSFIGAKLETLEALKRRCAGHIHHLHTNYRSPKYLLDLQNDYAKHNLWSSPASQLPASLSPVSLPPNKEDLCLLDVGDAQLESYYAARFAKRYGDLDPDGRVAILVSTKR